MGAGIALSTVAATAAQNQRGRGQHAATMARGNDSLSMPVAEGRASCVSTATADPTESIALVDTPERAGDITQLSVHRIACLVVMMFMIIVSVIIVIFVVMAMARTPMFAMPVVIIVVVFVVGFALAWTVFVLGGMFGVGVFSLLNILVRRELLIGLQGNATDPSNQ